MRSKLGRGIAALRYLRGMSVTGFAATLEMKKSEISRIENGTRELTLAEFFCIALCLRVSIYQLLDFCSGLVSVNRIIPANDERSKSVLIALWPETLGGNGWRTIEFQK
jgi:transcriptional regulator with XRE-family HTH domain